MPQAVFASGVRVGPVRLRALAACCIACMRDAAAAAMRKPFGFGYCSNACTAAIRHVLQLYMQSAVQYYSRLSACMPWVCVRFLHRLLLPQFYVTVVSDLTGPAGAARKVRFRVFIYRSSRNWFFSHVFVREIAACALTG